MNEASNPYASPKADLTLGKVDVTTNETAIKLGKNTYQWENRCIRFLAEPATWFRSASLFVLVGESQKFRPGNSGQVIFWQVAREREVPIQVDLVHSFVPWRKRFNLFIGETFIDHSIVHIQKWWRPFVFLFIFYAILVGLLGLEVLTFNNKSTS
jgi:hypothetical protein